MNDELQEVHGIIINMKNSFVTIIGGGLAGTEAAYYLAERGIPVRLYEMRNLTPSPAHHTDLLGELVCSNSLKSEQHDNACGLLKEEMRIIGSLMLEAAEHSRVPAGNALSVDRNVFAEYITHKIENHPLITVIREEVKKIDEFALTIIASGPLTSPSLTNELQLLVGQNMLSFFDASAPIVTLDSLDLNTLYWKSRYDQDSGSYLNSAMDETQYDEFYQALISAQKAPLHSFDTSYFDGCLPIEEIARRGYHTLRFGPLKPRGLRKNPEDRPFAVVQMRQDNVGATLFNIVGFQTNLTYPEQRRVFRMIPGLENAEFVRYGLMHRNSYIKAPIVLKNTLQMKKHATLLIAGQLTGVEGYVESAAMGLLAAINAKRIFLTQAPVTPPISTMIGSLVHYITNCSPDAFAPMNANFGILYGSNKNHRLEDADRAINSLKEWLDELQ